MIEREAKLGAPSSFHVPDLSGVVPGAVVHTNAVRLLDATYYDGKDRPLASLGITVRHRTGEGAPRWTVKLGRGSDAGVLERDEIDVEGPSDVLPAGLRDLVAEQLGDDELVPVARLLSARETIELHAADGTRLAAVDDDVVRVLDGDDEVGSFREVEVELAPGAPESVLEAVVARLRASGAGEPDPTPKLVRALRLLEARGSAS